MEERNEGFLKDLHKDFVVQPVIHTGIDGLSYISNAIHRHNLIDYAKFLNDKELLSSEQLDKVIDMIESKDKDNLILAEEILKQLQSSPNFNPDASASEKGIFDKMKEMFR